MKRDTQQGWSAQNLLHVNTEQCVGCGACAKVCYRRAISFTENEKADIFLKRCAGIDNCGRCVNVCENNAIEGRR